MKTRFRFAAVLLVALAGSLVQQAAHAYALFFETASNPMNVSVGSTFTVRVMLDDPAALASFDFAVGYDQTLLSLTSASASTLAANFFPTIRDTEGLGTFSTVDLTGLDPNATGPISLVEISFKALADGSTSISVLDDPLDVNLQPSLGFNLPADIAKPDVSDAKLDVNIRTGTVRVPEPASLALLGVAIAAAGVGAARRRAAA